MCSASLMVVRLILIKFVKLPSGSIYLFFFFFCSMSTEGVDLEHYSAKLNLLLLY